ncbi:MAG: hypothetical protein KBE65_11560 [Phycisphaerae bacterium]|nr:hypothetical protein [Phycisphaerae bacterium]
MTRRKFLYHISIAVSVVGGWVGWMSRRVLPRRIVRAGRSKNYPGVIVPMGDIRMQSKWSG